MDKYEYKVRSDEIKSLIAQGNYAQAAEIADTIDWRRVKSVMMLCTVSDVYKINRRYEDAKNMLLLAYERRPGGRTICYSLCELCIKTEEFVQALNYFKEFTQVAPRDTGRYILQYKLYEAQEVSLEERIGVLEELKKRDYREKWAYELAYLYHRVGLGTRCVEECDELILWFGEGRYVVKAMELKMLHQPLTPAQQEVYDRRFEEPAEEMEPEYQEAYGEEAAYGEEPVEGQEGDYGWPSEEGRLEEEMQEPLPEEGASGQDAGEELDIQVKTVDVGQYNTINLQAELAAGLQEVLGADGTVHGAPGEPGRGEARTAGMPEDGGYQDYTEEEIEDSEVFFGATGELEDASLELEEPGGAGYEEAAAEGQWQDPEPGAAGAQGYDPGRAAAGQGQGLEQMPAEERHVPEPGAVGAQGYDPRRAAVGQGQSLERMPAEERHAPEQGAVGAQEPGAMAGRRGEAQPERKAKGVQALPEGENGEPGAAASPEGATGQDVGLPPRELAEVLSQEADGQISMVLPESAAVEKQITGQMKIEDILAEWERIKKENEAKCQEEVRQHVLSQTGPMFTEFEATVRDGLLEQLEKGEAEQNGPEEAVAEQAAAGMEAGGTRAAEPEEGPGCMPGEENPVDAGSPEGQEAAAYAGGDGPEHAEQAGYDAAADMEGEPGYVEEAAYENELGYVEEGAYEGEPGYTEEGAYEGEPGYVEEAVYEGEPGYAEEAVYENEPGYARGIVYADDPEYIEEAGAEDAPETMEDEYGEAVYDEAANLEEEAAYENEPGYVEEAVYEGEPGYAEEAVYENEPGYAEEGAYADDSEYIKETGAEDAPETMEDEYGEAVYDEAANLEDEAGYAEEGAYEGGPGYAEEAAYGNEPGYAEEAVYENEPGYAEEAAYADESGYAEEAAYADEPEYIEEAGAEDAPDGREPDDIIGEIEEIQEQIEKAGEGEQPARTGRSKSGKTDRRTEGDDKPPIERDQEKVRGLTREEKELFAPFIQNRRSREQLVKALDGISMAAYTGNLIITGEEGMDTLTLAKNIMREVRMMDSNFSGKVAKVSGQGLNEKDVAQTLEQLGNGALIIQKASGMSTQTAAMLHRQLQHERFGIIVVLEDTGKAIKKLFLGTPDLYGDFTARIDLEALSNDALVAFGRQYAREKEFSIDNLGILALHTRIEELQTIDHVVTVMEVKQIVDEAIRHASRKTLAHFFDVLLAKRYDDEDMIILTEKDFAA